MPEIASEAEYFTSTSPSWFSLSNTGFTYDNRRIFSTWLETKILGILFILILEIEQYWNLF